MKQLLLFLTILGLGLPYTGFSQNYRICLIDNKYTICDKKTPIIHYSKKALARDKVVMEKLQKMDTEVFMGYSEPASVAKTRSNMRVYVDDPNGAYQGSPTLINDGVRKNMVRNINYGNGGVDLPPNDGR
jgi:hypothetical protein